MTTTSTVQFDGNQVPAGFAELVQTGREALNQGDLAAARESFVAVTRRFPAESVGHNNLGGFYMGLGEHAAAAASFERVLELQPECTNSRFNLGVAHYGLEDYDAAIAAFAAVAEATPDDPEVLNNLGAARFGCGLQEQAREDLLAALQLQPNFPSAVLNLCELELAAGDTAGALGLCEAYLEHHHDLGVLRRYLEIVDAVRTQVQPALKAEG